MEFIYENTISEKPVNLSDKKMTLELTKRLEENNYMTPFDGLKDWNFLQALIINSPELSSKLYKSP